jgi:hypothetical protein
MVIDDDDDGIVFDLSAELSENDIGAFSVSKMVWKYCVVVKIWIAMDVLP